MREGEKGAFDIRVLAERERLSRGSKSSKDKNTTLCLLLSTTLLLLINGRLYRLKDMLLNSSFGGGRGGQLGGVL